jgi:hypothetical protein
MSHFAKVENGIVTEVIVAEQDFINSGIVGDAFNWIQTSYSSSFRGKFAVPGDTWDTTKGIFISPQLRTSWILNSDNNWESPTPKPANTGYTWDEDTTSWVETIQAVKDAYPKPV